MNRLGWRVVIDVAASICMILAAAVIIANYLSLPSRPQPIRPLPSEPISLAGAAMVGKQSARVVLTEFTDFQCPYCARFAIETWPQLLAEYVNGGRVLMAFRHLPLTTHQLAWGAAAAATCANRQGKFLEMYELMFNSRKLAADDISAHAKAISLTPSLFARCLQADAAAVIASDLDQARALHISSTPTFLLGTRMADGRVKVTQRLDGAVNFMALRKEVDSALSAARWTP